MQINFVYDSSAASAPAGFISALNYVAGVLDALITNPITLNIAVGWGEINGAPIGSGAISEGGDSPGIFMSFNQLVAELRANASSSAAQQELALLPPIAPSQLPSNYFVSSAQEKAWGLISPIGGAVDGAIGFSSAVAWDFNPSNQNVAGEYGFIGVAEHEITHAMGRQVGVGAFDLVNYSAPGILNRLNTNGGYFSVNGGVTDLGNFASANQDPSDWANALGDAFNYATRQGLGGILSPVDLTLMGALGFSIQAGATPVPTPAPTVTPGLAILDTTTGQPVTPLAQPYTGPVAGLQEQYINITTDSLNITATTPSWFIVTGSGNDAIAVTSGTNVLDGGPGSNFLTGGSGADTFFVDDRHPGSAIWSTVVGFHTGDNLTLWGVTRNDFNLSWLDGQGAAGYTGLTLHATEGGRPTASVTLAGFTSADLANGRLSVAFGATPNEPGLPGAAYMIIHGA